MLQKIRVFLVGLLDSVLPPRTDFAIVKKLDADSIANLPRAVEVKDLDWIYPLFQYKNEKVKAIIWELKYKENTLPLEHIGKVMYEEILSHISDIRLFDHEAEFLLIPIPISDKRRSERGFNQSEYIAKAVIENDLPRTLLYAPQWLRKVKDTERQSHSESREERKINLLGSFEADERVAGKYVILIDDVVTTGSTLLEARNTLDAAGAQSVSAFTVAH